MPAQKYQRMKSSVEPSNGHSSGRDTSDFIVRSKTDNNDEVSNIMLDLLLKPKHDSHNLSQGVLSNPSAKSRFAPTVGQIEGVDMLDYSGSSGRKK